MLWFPDKMLAVVTPPHTASGNTHKFFTTESDAYWVMGEEPFGDDISHHTTKMPAWWAKDGVKVYVVCRDPYTRMVGLFLHYQWGFSIGRIVEYLDWKEFVYNIKDSNTSWIFKTSITSFLIRSGLEDFSLIRYENIEEELSSALGEEVKLKERYHEPIELDKWYYDQDILDFVNENWAIEDCNTFGYDIKWQL
jgi:hypothetical protein